MKKLKNQRLMNRILILLFLLTLISCKKEKIDSEPYFKLDNIGLSLLSGIKINDTLNFVGSNNTRQTYMVYKIEKSKETVQDCSFTTGYCKIYYHFEKVKFGFTRIDSVPLPPSAPLTYSLTVQMQLPVNFDNNNIPKDVQPEAFILGNAFINYNAIPLNSPSYTSPYIIYPDFYSTISTKTYTNSSKAYNEVIVIKSGNNLPYVNPVYGFVSTANEVWFDKKYGFVFFKDVFGNTWSKTN